MKGVALIVVGLVLFIGSILALDYGGFMWESFMLPKRENMHRKVFEQTKSYNQGMQQELISLMHEYNTAKDPLEKKAIASTVRHKYADFDESVITSPELKSFLEKCKYGE